MRKIALYSLLLLVALNAFGHAGEVHKYMGTIQTLEGDGFVLKTTDGQSVPVTVGATTAFLQADGKAAKRSDLAAGGRVVVTISKDGKTATTIRFAAKK